MLRIELLRELFRYNDWAREQVLAAAEPLGDRKLDQPFEIGEGSLRKTIYHLWAAEYGWLNRWLPQPDRHYDAECHGEALTEIRRRFAETAGVRDDYLQHSNDGELDRTVTYTNSKGVTSTFTIGQMMLQVCNHGTHHRAQALNMLRHLGGAVPNLDYVALLREEQSGELSGRPGHRGGGTE